MDVRHYEPSDRNVPPYITRLVGEQTGIIRGLFINFLDRGDPTLVTTQPELSNVHTLPPERTNKPSFGIGGKGRSLKESLITCVGETAERYSSYFPDYESMIDGTYRELVNRGLNVVDIRYLDIYEDSQYDKLAEVGIVDQPFAEDTTIRWCEGTNLISGESVYVPAQLVYLGMDGTYPTCCVGTSNGGASHTTLKAALQSSIRECIERDAFMATWFRRQIPTKLDCDTIDSIRRLKRELENGSVEFHVFRFETETDFHAIGCAAVNNKNVIPKFVLGGAASLDVHSAINDALLEAAQGWQYGKFLNTEYNIKEINLKTIDDFERNVAYYSHPDNYDAVRFLVEGKQLKVEPSEMDDNLQRYISILDDNDYTPVAFDLTTRDIREVGLWVTKVYIPELLGLSLPSFPPKSHPKIQNDDITEYPHPYP